MITTKHIKIEKVQDGYRITFCQPAPYGVAGQSYFFKEYEEVIAVIASKREYFNN
jgi:hypothetical protein